MSKSFSRMMTANDDDDDDDNDEDYGDDNRNDLYVKRFLQLN